MIKSLSLSVQDIFLLDFRTAKGKSIFKTKASNELFFAHFPIVTIICKQYYQICIYISISILWNHFQRLLFLWTLSQTSTHTHKSNDNLALATKNKVVHFISTRAVQEELLIISLFVSHKTIVSVLRKLSSYLSDHNELAQLTGKLDA